MTGLMTVWAAAAAGAWVLALLFCRSALRNASAAARHFVLASSFLTVLLAPATLLLLPSAQPVRALRSTFIMIVTPEGDTAGALPASDDRATTLPIPWQTVFAVVWATGAVIACSRLLIGIGRVTAASVAADPRVVALGGRVAQELGLRRTVEFRKSERAGVAETHGWRRPTVVVPPDAADWSDDRLDVVLRHELTHIVRQDWPVTVMASLCAALHWFNPLARVALRKLFEERELACDDQVLSQGVNGCDYADHLLSIVAARQPQLEEASVAMAQASHLERRIRSLVRTDIKRGGVTMNAKFGAGAIAACLLLIAAAVQAPAQGGTAGLSGTVVDPSNGRVPNASVIVRNAATGTTEIVRTDQAGQFTFSSLPAGDYTVEVAMRGFKLWSQPKITLAPASAQNVSVTLDVGTLRETIDVNGAGPTAVPGDASRPPQRLRVGGNVQAAKLVRQVRPTYPQHLKEAGVQGSVLMEAVIAIDGSIRNLKVLNTQVHPDLAKVATEAASQWRYEPTYLNGNPVEILTAITVNFTLQP